MGKRALEHSARTAIASTASLLVASLFRLPEAYWAVVTTMIVMQSTLGAAWSISTRRLAGTALGAAAGAILATYFGPSVVAFGIGLFLLGMICSLLGKTSPRIREQLDKTAYRFAGITLAITMLIARTISPWIVAVHRFIEVAIGIAIGLLMSYLWPDREHDAGQVANLRPIGNRPSGP